MHSVCCCSLPVWRRSFLKKGTPRDLFLPRPGSAPGRIWPKNNNTCKGPWVLHPYQVSSKSIKRFWRRSRNVNSLTDDRRQTTDGRRTTRDHLWLLCPKNPTYLPIFFRSIIWEPEKNFCMALQFRVGLILHIKWQRIKRLSNDIINAIERKLANLHVPPSRAAMFLKPPWSSGNRSWCL